MRRCEGHGSRAAAALLLLGSWSALTAASAAAASTHGSAALPADALVRASGAWHSGWISGDLAADEEGLPAAATAQRGSPPQAGSPEVPEASNWRGNSTTGSTAAPAAAGLPPLIPLRLLMGPPRFRYPQLSPDGGHLAFIQPAPGTGLNSIFVAALPPSSGSTSSSSSSSSSSRSFFGGNPRSGSTSSSASPSSSSSSSHADLARSGPVPAGEADVKVGRGGDGNGTAAAAMSGVSRPVQVTFTKGHGVSDYFWLRDGRGILFLVDSGSGSEDYQLFLVPLEYDGGGAGKPGDTGAGKPGGGGSGRGGGGSSSRQVTPGPAINLTPTKGVKVQGLWLSNALPRRAFAGINQRLRSTFDIYSINLDSHNLTLDTVNPGDVTSWLVDPTYKISAAVVSRSDGSRALKVRNPGTPDGCSPPAAPAAASSSSSSSSTAAGAGHAAAAGRPKVITEVGRRVPAADTQPQEAANALPAPLSLLRGLRRLRQLRQLRQPHTSDSAQQQPAAPAKAAKAAKAAAAPARAGPSRGADAGSSSSSSGGGGNSSSVHCPGGGPSAVADGTLDGSGGDLGVDPSAPQAQQQHPGCAGGPGGGMAALVASSASGSNVTCWRELYVWPLGEEGRVWGFSKSGDGLYVSSSRDRDTAELQLISRADGSLRRRVASHPLVDVGDVVVDPATRAPAAVSFDYHKPAWRWAAEADQADWERLAAWQPDAVLLPVSWSRDKQTLVVAYSKGDGNNAYYLVRRGAFPPALLFHEQPALLDHTLVLTHPVVITARDGLRLPAYLTLPPLPGMPQRLPPGVSGVGADGMPLAAAAAAAPAATQAQDSRKSAKISQPQKPQLQPQQQQQPGGSLDLDLPMVLLVHGGPWRRTFWGSSAGVVQWLANRGYAVLNVNFRGSSGYGKRFASAGDKQWGIGAMQQDLTDSVAWAVAKGIADPKRVCIMGGSYGGYATLAGLAFTPQLYACGISFSGITDLAALVATMPPWWSPLKQRWLHRVGNVTSDAALNRALSPVYHADAITAPLLMGQGGNDVRVTQAAADAMYAALKQRKGRRDGTPPAPVSYVLYPNEGHGLTQVANRVDFHSRAEQLLARVLGGRTEPPPARPLRSSVQVRA